MSAPASVLVGCFDRIVCLKIEGKGTFQVSVGVKDFVNKMIARGYREFVVDLERCELMDSTFMGILAGTALRLRELGEGRLRIIRANERNSSLLSGLGLDQLFEVSQNRGNVPVFINDDVVTTRVASMPPPEGEQKEVVLEAHEALAAADAANAAKFHDVIDFLKQELGHGDSGESGSSKH